MKNGFAWAGLTLAWASTAAAHPGAHVHPHDGAHWLVTAGALAVLAIAGGLAVAKVRSRK